MRDEPIPTQAEERAAFLALRRSVAAAIEMAEEERIDRYRGTDDPRAFIVELRRALSEAVKFSFGQIRKDQASGDFRVAVFNSRRRSGKNSPNAYLRDYSPEWRPCMHEVCAANGREAKRLAIAEHLASKTCDQRDSHEVIGG